jgi:hypothetical protein
MLFWLGGAALLFWALAACFGCVFGCDAPSNAYDIPNFESHSSLRQRWLDIE